MGMFDDIYVAESLIDPLFEEAGLDIKWFKNSNSSKEFGYYFQTKNLECLLDRYFIKEDKNLYEIHQEFEWIETDKNRLFKTQAKSIGEPTFHKVNKTVTLEFYNSYETEEDSVFITFNAEIVGGQLRDKIKLESIHKNNLAEIRQRQLEYQEKSKKMRETWEWKAYNILSKWGHKFERFLDILLKNARKKSNNDF